MKKHITTQILIKLGTEVVRGEKLTHKFLLGGGGERWSEIPVIEF